MMEGTGGRVQETATLHTHCFLFMMAANVFKNVLLKSPEPEPEPAEIFKLPQNPKECC